MEATVITFLDMHGDSIKKHHAEDRPTMLSVVLMLVSEGPLPEPKQPAFFSEESNRELKSLPSIDARTITLMYGR
ncbi:putative non-specific serine/threonine protein kinase [Helianthus annuus]|nr:putative non-specific serine/threonine protein kinase [Helianthus annuus]